MAQNTTLSVVSHMFNIFNPPAPQKILNYYYFFFIIFKLIVTDLRSSDQKSDFRFIIVNVNSESNQLAETRPAIPDM